VTAADNTARSFSDKWHENRDLAFEQTNTAGSDISNWILERNGFADLGALRTHLASRTRILDAGCGNGRVTALLQSHAPEEAEIVGVDLTAADVARENLAGRPNVRIEEGNLLEDLSRLGGFDFIYCQEVLHHTPDPQGGFRNLARLLEPGGEIAIYVYRIKGPVREFVDDLVRARIADMPYEQAMEVARRITELGRALSEIEAEVTVPEIPELGIEAGDYSVQRLVYHYFMKCFWNEELGFEASAAVNYDWYHPQTCSRHTPDEVRAWFEDAGLTVVHEYVDPYGITMRGRRVAPRN
jgi:SAM-dependent methyltransferase